MKAQKRPYEKILTIESLTEIKRANRGYIVVTESLNPNVIHKPRCPKVTTYHFKTRVIAQAANSGQYFRVSDAELGRKAFGAVECLDCLSSGQNRF